jgi:hypothetical protein
MAMQVLDLTQSAEPPFTRAESLSTLILFMLGGTQTSIAALTNVLHRMAATAAAWDLGRTREGATALVKEALRLQPPVLFSLVSTNRDERRFPNADNFDPANLTAAPLSFSSGPHACPGMGLAIAELIHLAETFVARFDGMDVVPGTDDFVGIPSVSYKTWRCSSARPTSKDLMTMVDDRIELLRKWIREANPSITEIPQDLDIIDARLVTSLQFVSFILYIEQLRGSPINTDQLDIASLRTLDDIERNYLS